MAEQKNITNIVNELTDKAIKGFAGSGNTKGARVIDNIVSFIGLSGGTGTSTITANVANSIANMGFSVLLVDMNILYPIQHSFYSVKQGDKNDLITFITGKNEIGASIETLDKISLLFSNNRYLIDLINCDTKTCSNNLVKAIEQIRGLFDMIIFDCPLSLENDLTNSILYLSDNIYCVMDEGLSCIANIDRVRKNMQLSGIDHNKMKIVFNKKTNVYYTRYIFDSLNIDVTVTLPFDTAIIESSLKGELFCEKGASTSKNAGLFVAGIDRLAEILLENGGYREN